MIIDASPTLTFLLFGVGETRHMAIVVVTPHQRHVVGHLKTALKNLQHLFIRDKDLRNFLHLLIIILTDKFTLVIDDLLQALQLFLFGLHTLHRTVVDAAHADGKELLRTFHLLETLYPVLLHLFTIGDIVVGTAFGMIPFGHVVPEQGLAMAGSDKDTTRVGHLLIAWNGKKTRSTCMHAWPDGVGT